MATKKVPADAHVFGRPTPSANKGFKLHFKLKRDTHFRELPPPTGAERLLGVAGRLLPSQSSLTFD